MPPFPAIIATRSGRRQCNSCGGASADPVADFYRGKVVNVNIGFSAGGGFDLYARTVARYLSRYIPGHPTIIPRQMPGAGSVRAAQYLYAVAPQDGTQIATIAQSLPLQQAFGDVSTFDLRRFNWIGNPINGVSTVGVWAASGITTLDQAKTRQVTIGATGYNVTMQYPLALNAIAGTRFKVVLGYPGGHDIELAMERGELDGMGQISWASLTSARREWLKEKQINLLVQIGQHKNPKVDAYMGHEVPLLSDLGHDDNERRMLELLSSGEVVGRPLMTTPNVPPERVAALRAAFDATMRDPEFLAQAKQMGLDVDPIGGAELQRIVERIVSSPLSVVKKLRSIVEQPNPQKANPKP